jgi:hypothetical protein
MPSQNNLLSPMGMGQSQEEVPGEFKADGGVPLRTYRSRLTSRLAHTPASGLAVGKS